MKSSLAAAVVAGTALALASTASGGGFPHFGAGCSRDNLSVSGRTVRAELCRASPSSARAVVVLHGCGGFSTFDHRIVTSLPKDGISTLDVDYFGLTPPPGTKGFCDARGTIGGVFPLWIETVAAAAAKLRATPGISRRGVGIVGWSLGGGVAVAAAEQLHAFDALAGFSTGAFGAENGAADLPPTILLSGGRRDAIPLAETLPLYHALRRAHVPTSIYVYPHGSHNWPGAQGTAGIAHAAAFLKRYLR
jgi:carboxymethylenebutenolidase